MNRQQAEELLKDSKAGVQKWNQLRQQNQLIPSLDDIDLSGCMLRGVNFYKAQLRGAKFHGADLTGANLNEAILHGAEFQPVEGPERKPTILCGIKAAKAEFNNADLREVDLGRKLDPGNSVSNNASFAADLDNAKLVGADLGKAKLHTTNLRGANLTDAKLNQAELWGAVLQGATLTGANVAGADFREANLTNTVASKLLGVPQARNLHKIELARPDAYPRGFETYTVQWHEKIRSWEFLRKIGELKLFGISYALMGCLMVYFFLGHVYNQNLQTAQRWAEQVQVSRPADDGRGVESKDGDVSKTTDAAIAALADEVLDYKPLCFPWHTVWLFISTILLACASTIYSLWCPAEVKAFSQEHWVYELHRSHVHYAGYMWQMPARRFFCSVFYGIGGPVFVVILFVKVCYAMSYVFQHGSFFS